MRSPLETTTTPGERTDGTAVDKPQVVEVFFEPIDATPPRHAKPAADQDEPRPTLARPRVPSAGLFQGWGPRL